MSPSNPCPFMFASEWPLRRRSACSPDRIFSDCSVRFSDSDSVSDSVEETNQIADITRFENRPGDAELLDLVEHPRPVFPERRGERDGCENIASLAQPRAKPGAFGGGAVAVCTAAYPK